MRIELIRRRIPQHTVSSNHVDRVKYHDLRDDSGAELQNWCKAGRLLVMKFQVGIVLHDARIYLASFDIWKEVSNRNFSEQCGYGLDLRYTGFSITVQAQPHR